MTTERENRPRTTGDLAQAALRVKQFAESAGLDTELTRDSSTIQFTDLHVFVYPKDYGISYLMDRAQIVGCAIRSDTLSLRSPDAIQPIQQMITGEYICNMSLSDEYYREITMSTTDPQVIYDCIDDWLKRMEKVSSELTRRNIESSAAVLARSIEKEGQPCPT